MTKLSPFRPLLASPAPDDLGKLRFPVIASPKLDGIRVFLHPELGPVTRTLKPVPNDHVRGVLSAPELTGLDGEIVVGSAVAPDVFNATTRAVMSKKGTPDFTFWVFDQLGSNLQYFHTDFRTRLAMLRDHRDPIWGEHFPLCRGLEQVELHTLAELEAYEGECLARGFEGVMLRGPHGFYKFGRSTEREGILLKLKRFSDLEALVVGYVGRFRNENAATVNALGLTERSGHKAGMVADDALGALIVTHPKFKLPFQVGSGFDEAGRREIWANREDYVGALARVRYQEIGSTPDAPRFPTFTGWRSPLDAGAL